jgi:hypothetical protein
MSWFERARRYVTESLKELWIRPPHQVPALDGLRALAILLVVCAHFYGNFWSSHVREELPGMSNLPMFLWGWTGVDLFFVLSGYLIGKQLWRERITTGSIRFWPFILRRGMRIWPLFYFMLLFYTLVPSEVQRLGLRLPHQLQPREGLRRRLVAGDGGAVLHHHAAAADRHGERAAMVDVLRRHRGAHRRRVDDAGDHDAPADGGRSHREGAARRDALPDLPAL